MKTPIIAMAASAAFFAPVASLAGSFEDHFGGQEGVNAHFQGTDHRLEDRIDHLQRSDTNNNAWDTRQQAQIDNNTAWNDRQEGELRGMKGDIKANAEWDDRQEGVIRQNRGRLDENDARNQRQDASIDNAHARIGGVIKQADSDRAVVNGNTDRSIGNQQAIGFLQETDAQLSGAIQQGQQAHAVTDKRSINNADRLDGAEGAIRETNGQLAVTDKRTIQNARTIAATQTRVEDVNRQSIVRDKELGGRLDQQAQRDDALAAESGRIESESIQRDDTASADRRRIESESVQRDTDQNAKISSNRRDVKSNSDLIVRNKAQQDADRTASLSRDQRIESDSISRDNELNGRIGAVDSDSRKRDTVIANQVDYNEQVNAAYRRQSAAQFEQHGAAIESNRQAIADERNERQQMGKDLNAGISGALAAAAATFDPSYYGAQLSVSGGSYRGESAVGLSIGARATESLFINGGVVHDSRGHQGLNAAVNWKL